MEPSSSWIDRTYLQANARTILARGPLSARQIDVFLAGGALDDPEIVVQVSSGSTGRPLRIPRSRRDVGDIARRVIAPFARRAGIIPARVALLGGISHAQAAMKFSMGGSEMMSFEAHQVDELAAFDPVVISCYPSVARELVRSLPPAMPGLRAFKLGGEKIYRADLAKLFGRFPDLLVIEQLGSTEVPAIALRVMARGEWPPYELQTERFSFQLPEQDGWWPLVVRDDFEDLLFPVREFYATGDEVRLENGQVQEVRRSNDAALPFQAAAEELLNDPGCINVQFDPARRRVIAAGEDLPAGVAVGSIVYTVERGDPARIPVSNKLPLLVPNGVAVE